MQSHVIISKIYIPASAYYLLSPRALCPRAGGTPPSLMPDLLAQVPDLGLAMVSFRALWLAPGPKTLAAFGKGETNLKLSLSVFSLPVGLYKAIDTLCFG